MCATSCSSRSSREKADGVGLGLCVASDVAARHGGQLNWRRAAWHDGIYRRVSCRLCRGAMCLAFWLSTTSNRSAGASRGSAKAWGTSVVAASSAEQALQECRGAASRRHHSRRAAARHGRPLGDRALSGRVRQRADHRDHRLRRPADGGRRGAPRRVRLHRQAVRRRQGEGALVRALASRPDSAAVDARRCTSKAWSAARPRCRKCTSESRWPRRPMPRCC